MTTSPLLIRNSHSRLPFLDDASDFESSQKLPNIFLSAHQQKPPLTHCRYYCASIAHQHRAQVSRTDLHQIETCLSVTSSHTRILSFPNFFHILYLLYPFAPSSVSSPKEPHTQKLQRSPSPATLGFQSTSLTKCETFQIFIHARFPFFIDSHLAGCSWVKGIKSNFMQSLQIPINHFNPR